MEKPTPTSRRKRLVHYIAGDGFCCLKSVLVCLLKDHQIEMECKEVIQIITEQLIDHHDQYVAFHNVIAQSDPNVSNSDLLVTEAMDFLKTGSLIEMLLVSLCKSFQMLWD